MDRTGILSPEQRAIAWEVIGLVVLVNLLALIMFGLFDLAIGYPAASLADWVGDTRLLPARTDFQPILLYFYGLNTVLFYYGIGRAFFLMQRALLPSAPDWLRSWYLFLWLILGIIGLRAALNMMQILHFETRTELASSFRVVQDELLFANLMTLFSYSLVGWLAFRAKTVPLPFSAVVIACGVVELVIVILAMQPNRPLFWLVLPNLIQGILSVILAGYLYLQLEADRLYREKTHA